MPNQPEFQARLQSIERLLGEIEVEANPSLRTSVRHLLQLVMDLHGMGIERMLDLVRIPPDRGEQILQKLSRDELVSSLLVLYGLHPLDLEARVNQAVDQTRPKLRAHEYDVQVLTIDGGAIRLRLQSSGHGCGSTIQAVKEILESAVYQAAPDITELVIEGLEDKHGFVPLEALQAAVAAVNADEGAR